MLSQEYKLHLVFVQSRVYRFVLQVRHLVVREHQSVLRIFMRLLVAKRVSRVAQRYQAEAQAHLVNTYSLMLLDRPVGMVFLEQTKRTFGQLIQMIPILQTTEIKTKPMSLVWDGLLLPGTTQQEIR